VLMDWYSKQRERNDGIKTQLFSVVVEQVFAADCNLVSQKLATCDTLRIRSLPNILV
jgi:hypothetical protein